MSKSDQHQSCLAGDSSNLDLLRSIAVLFVVANHLFVVSGRFFVGPLNVQEMGRLGVLFFFVHTCCVLMCSIARQEQKAPGRSLALSFFVRRAFRIYPLSILTVAFVSFFALPLGHFQNGAHVAVHMDRLGLFANYFLVQDIASRPSILVTLWSLPYEMHMYLLLPILYLLIKHRDGLFALIIIWVASIVVALNPYHMALIGLGGFSQFIPCFLPGIMAYRLSTQRRLPLPWILWPLFLLSIGCLYLAVPRIAMGWIICALLGCAIPQFREATHGAWKGFSRIVARYSYGIYLTHLICIWFAFERLHALPTAAKWLIFLVTASVVPVILYHAVESPMIDLGRRLSKRFSRKRSVVLPPIVAHHAS